jgi:DNA-binding ferritin-like protein (Dps family)
MTVKELKDKINKIPEEYKVKYKNIYFYLKSTRLYRNMLYNIIVMKIRKHEGGIYNE